MFSYKMQDFSTKKLGLFLTFFDNTSCHLSICKKAYDPTKKHTEKYIYSDLTVVYGEEENEHG